MSLHRHKVHNRPGAADFIAIGLAVLLAIFLLVGALVLPGAEWKETKGEIRSVRLVQNATSPDGTPHRVQLDYSYSVNDIQYGGAWEGEWPHSHSPNALPEGGWEMLKEPGYTLVVMYDPEHPASNSIHALGNRLPDWWFRVSLALCIGELWFVISVYPHWKMIR